MFKNISMKKIIVLTIVIFTSFFVTNLNAAPIKGAGVTSCGSWLNDRKTGDYYQQLNWVLGFVSSYNNYHQVSKYGKNGVFRALPDFVG